MNRLLFSIGCVSAFLGVGAGAFGAHGLKAHVTPEMLETWKTGAAYQLTHAIAMTIAAVAAGSLASRFCNIAGWLFLIGTIIFSGSLYLLVLTNVRWLGAITPLGGLCFLTGWLVLAWAGITSK